jgi:hypothetical protein
MSAADDQSTYDFIARTGTTLCLYLYHSDMLQGVNQRCCSFHVILYVKELLVVLFTSMVLEYISVSNRCGKLQK